MIAKKNLSIKASLALASDHIEELINREHGRLSNEAVLGTDFHARHALYVASRAALSQLAHRSVEKLSEYDVREA
jgi:hypothetical protein